MANIFGELLLLVLTDDVSQARAMVGILLRKHTDVPFHHQIIGPSSSVNYLLKLALALQGVFGSLTGDFWGGNLAISACQKYCLRPISLPAFACSPI